MAELEERVRDTTDALDALGNTTSYTYDDVMADLDWTPEFFLYEHPRPHVARITINRPEVRNAINTPAHKEWSDLLDHAAADPEIWIVVVTGAGSGTIRP